MSKFGFDVSSIFSQESRIVGSGHSKSDIAIQAQESFEEEPKPIRIIGIIFLPFQGWWQIIIMMAVITKCFLGPLRSVMPFLQCSSFVDKDTMLSMLQYYYIYVVDILYIIDTFLYIIHRQVTDEAMKREFTTKPAKLLFLDLLALIPFFELVGGDICQPPTAWPNILHFHEMFIIYRVAYYFSLNVTHSYCKMILGYMIMFFLLINFISCMYMLFTFSMSCKDCKEDVNLLDYRSYGYSSLKGDKGDLWLYIYTNCFVTSQVLHYMLDETRPNTYVGYIICDLIMEFGFLMIIIVLLPKLFSENLMRIIPIYSFQSRVTRMLEDTRRRNPSPNAWVSVEKFYELIWSKQNGITSMPEVIDEIPRSLRLEITLDLTWPLFHHSPSLRSTSSLFKRWMSQHVSMEYKLPGERFFFGPDCYTKLYYLRTGIVQFISVDDSTIPLLSVSGGTVFGDLNYYVPPFNRQIAVRCFTYCEIFSISRNVMLKALHIFPNDRKHVLQSVKQRVGHARALYENKKNIRGLDRCEDEGIAWLKHRWHEVTDYLKKGRKASKRQQLRIPMEDTYYHCSKFIGQQVLCKNYELQTKSMFYEVKFPWVLDPFSIFSHVWYKIVIATIYLVLFLYPLTIVRLSFSEPTWYAIFELYVNIVYVGDVIITLLTAKFDKEYVETDIMTKIFDRCKNIYFILDLMSTPLVDILANLLLSPEYALLFKFNRLIKIYLLFIGRYKKPWNQNHLHRMYYVISLSRFCSHYIMSFFFFIVLELTPVLSPNFFYGNLCLEQKNDNISRSCFVSTDEEWGFLSIAVEWIAIYTIPDTPAKTYYDILIWVLLTLFYVSLQTVLKIHYISTLYLKFKYITAYQYFVTKIKEHYTDLKIHPDLLKRLDRYLNLHWKYAKGTDIIHPHDVKDEPYDIYYKVHGELAEKIIGESLAFKNANIHLIKAVANEAKFLIIPSGSIIYAAGVQVETVTWCVRGVFKCEYQDEECAVKQFIVPTGVMLATGTVFFGQTALRTYSAASDCEILFINLKTFVRTIKKYPEEWKFFYTCISEYSDQIVKLHIHYTKKFEAYQNSLRVRIFHDRQSIISFKSGKKSTELIKQRCSFKCPEFLKDIRRNPEAKVTFYWFGIRAFTVVVSLLNFGLYGGSGAIYYSALMKLKYICNLMTAIDMLVKFFIPYYDDRGIVVSEFGKCATHYLTRSFVCDLIHVIGAWPNLMSLILGNVTQRLVITVKSLTECIMLYIVIGFLNYCADRPSIYANFILMFKSQILLVVVAFVVSFFYVRDCIWSEEGAPSTYKYQGRSCWMPDYLHLDKHPTVYQMHLTFASALNVVQNAFANSSLGQIHFYTNRAVQCVVYLSLAAVSWYYTCYVVSKLILFFQKDILVSHDIFQLKTFLEEERIDKHVIENAINHFSYILRRAPPIDTNILISDQFSIVFKQDLQYYFYKKTLKASDTILKGGKPFCRQLASCSIMNYFLPDSEVLREFQLCPSIFIVHRGKVAVYQDGRILTTLTKGAMFGQLQGLKLRPIRIAVRTTEHTDLLLIAIKDFQDCINETIRKTIANNPQVKDDYMALKKSVPESPYNTVQYILRGKKTIKLPMMQKPVSAESSDWYARWLFLSWVLGPILSATLVLLLINVPEHVQKPFIWCILVLDVQFFLYLLTEFFTMELKVIEVECVYKYRGWRKLTEVGIYLDIISLTVPLSMMFMHNYTFYLLRVPRLYTLYSYHCQFSGFRARKESMFMKIAVVFLLIHGLTCGWMSVACVWKKHYDKFPIKLYPLPVTIYNRTNREQWVLPKERITGCARTTLPFFYEPENTTVNGFFVPSAWYADYLISLSYIVVLQTQINLDVVLPLTIKEIYYKIFARYCLYLLEMWMMSYVISYIHTRFLKLYEYDFRVNGLVKYLKQNGVCSFLRESVRSYTRLLWQKNKGSQLPAITKQAPICLREDILSALYIHHLQTPTLFHLLPKFFLRQLAVRFQRTVIFPGKLIVKAGDIHPCMYFIHEGEVDKLHVDSHGEVRTDTVLSTNGYFGLIPGLYPEIPYQHSFLSRTIVDLVYLNYDHWQDLLAAYPDLKEKLYEGAKGIKKEKTADKKV